MCDHIAPVFEGDLLSFEHKILEEKNYGNGKIKAIHSQVYVHRGNENPKHVLDWIPIIFIR